jgi:hypothetical protein
MDARAQSLPRVGSLTGRLVGGGLRKTAKDGAAPQRLEIQSRQGDLRWEDRAGLHLLDGRSGDRLRSTRVASHWFAVASGFAALAFATSAC